MKYNTKGSLRNTQPEWLGFFVFRLHILWVAIKIIDIAIDFFYYVLKNDLRCMIATACTVYTLGDTINQSFEVFTRTASKLACANNDALNSCQ